MIRYKGYWIRSNPLNGLHWIEIDGVKLCWCSSEADGKTKIDALLYEPLDVEGPDVHFLFK